VIVRVLSGIYSREPYWKDIVFFVFVIARRSESTLSVCDWSAMCCLKNDDL